MTAPLRFGTDGIRGSDADLTPEFVVALGRAAARALGVVGGERVVIGRDTRRSGPLLESALAAGLAAEGVNVERLGVIPTPAVAWLSADEDVVGVMISASHNVFSDNGIKFFARGGRKLSDEVEVALEAELDLQLQGVDPASGTGGAAPGTVVDRHGAGPGYVDAVFASLEGRRLNGLSVVVDPAHGAATVVAPEALERAGAAVAVLHAEPNGTNINHASGSTQPQALCHAVVDAGADLGLALDGDADRVIAVDHRGRLVDGDQAIAMLALDLKARGELRDDTVVVTVMTNLGFHRAMGGQGITVVQTPVGDRHVLAALEGGRWSLGGEQSGHVILHDLATTGDGLLTGLALADLVVRSQRPLADLAAAAMTRLPQVLRAVTVAQRETAISERLAAQVAAVEAELGDCGRVLLRVSGTEPVVRVMVEAPTHELAEHFADHLAAEVERLASTTP